MTHWILLRGLMREQRHWGEFCLQLKNALPEAAITCVDLPGNGALHAMTSPTRIQEMSAHCRQHLRSLGIKPPYRLLAVSMGAMVASCWCADYPDEVQCAVLINTSMKPFHPFYWRLSPLAYPLLLKLALSSDAAVQEGLVYDLTSHRDEVKSRVLRQWMDYRRQYTVSRGNAMRQLWAAARYQAPRDAPTMPILLLSSRQDRLVNARCSDALAKIWHADLVVHPWAGHDLPLDDGPWVARQIAAWLEAKHL